MGLTLAGTTPWADVPVAVEVDPDVFVAVEVDPDVFVVVEVDPEVVVVVAVDPDVFTVVVVDPVEGGIDPGPPVFRLDPPLLLTPVTPEGVVLELVATYFLLYFL